MLRTWHLAPRESWESHYFPTKHCKNVPKAIALDGGAWHTEIPTCGAPHFTIDTSTPGAHGVPAQAAKCACTWAIYKLWQLYTDVTCVDQSLQCSPQERGAAELYLQLSRTAAGPEETLQDFTARTLDLRQKILFASQESDSDFLIGLQKDNFQTVMQPYWKDKWSCDYVWEAHSAISDVSS